MSIQGPASAIPFEYARGVHDNEGAKLYPFTFDFTGAGGIVQNLITSLRERGLNSLACVWIDNSANSAFFTLSFVGTGQLISCAAKLQGIFPVISVPGMLNVAALTSSTAKVPVFFINKEITSASWLGQ